jgi:pimeloyl-ACP methyl ester carboxylesterase
MNKFTRLLLFAFALLIMSDTFAQPDSIVLKDIKWDKAYPAGSTELFIPSGDALLAGLIYRPNGGEKHPTLLLLHGFPGNERNLDLAQVVRARGWNVIYFNYRGSWGSQGKFSFKHCVEDVGNVVAFCNKFQDSLKIDTAHIVLFGHSMGAWVCIKALEQLPQVKKGFALSTWNIYADLKPVKSETQVIELAKNTNVFPDYFVLNSASVDIFLPAYRELSYYNLASNITALKSKQIIMLDEHPGNKAIADTIRNCSPAYFDYQVWDTDHGFTNKRASLMNKLISFLDK